MPVGRVAVGYRVSFSKLFLLTGVEISVDKRATRNVTSGSVSVVFIK